MQFPDGRNEEKIEYNKRKAKQKDREKRSKNNKLMMCVQPYTTPNLIMFEGCMQVAKYEMRCKGNMRLDIQQRYRGKHGV